MFMYVSPDNYRGQSRGRGETGRNACPTCQRSILLAGRNASLRSRMGQQFHVLLVEFFLGEIFWDVDEDLAHVGVLAGSLCRGPAVGIAMIELHVENLVNN